MTLNIKSNRFRRRRTTTTTRRLACWTWERRCCSCPLIFIPFGFDLQVSRVFSLLFEGLRTQHIFLLGQPMPCGQVASVLWHSQTPHNTTKYSTTSTPRTTPVAHDYNKIISIKKRSSTTAPGKTMANRTNNQSTRTHPYSIRTEEKHTHMRGHVGILPFRSSATLAFSFHIKASS